MAVVSITAALIFLGIFSLSLIEPNHQFMDLLFEAISAACTVGLSRGITGELQPASLFILMLSDVCRSFRSINTGLPDSYAEKEPPKAPNCRYSNWLKH